MSRRRLRQGIAIALAGIPAIAFARAPSYTTAQADAGAARYTQACALCHGPDLAGSFETPALTGRFVQHWAGVPLSALAAYIQRAMPLTAPGTLSRTDVIALTAFLLRANGAPPGHAALPATPHGLDHLIFPVSEAR